ncbi:MAG: NAD-dependent epimerase/dehydratase family protein [Actinobacteria bacterium]|nr:NAD-dependent epimerase/dehydratase family protein [Actinomycetota bacterium]
MRVLVTGGAGFIGSAVVDLLVAEGHDAVVLDALLPAAHRATPAYLNPRAEYVWGDLADEAAVVSCLRGVDAVSHQAAMVGLGLDLGDAPDYVRHNDLATAVLLRCLARAGFAGRLVLAGSMVVYGEGRYRCGVHGIVRPGPRPAERLREGWFEPSCPDCGRDVVPEAVPEAAAPDPRSVYAATKLHQEHLCACFAREAGVPLTVLRYHNVYGPRMPADTPYAGVAAIFRSAVEAGRRPRVFEDGGQRRDFVHVDDVARANLLALTEDSGRSHVCNIASGSPATVLEMATALSAASGGATEPLVTGEFRLGDVRHIFASVSHAEEVLGFRAGVRMADGMRQFATAALR